MMIRFLRRVTVTASATSHYSSGMLSTMSGSIRFRLFFRLEAYAAVVVSKRKDSRTNITIIERADTQVVGLCARSVWRELLSRQEQRRGNSVSEGLA